MKKFIIFATAYPYTAAILAIMWVGSALLLEVGPTLPFNLVIFMNTALSLIIASIGFRK